MSVSVVVPVYNEMDNVVLLHAQLGQVLPKTGRAYEIIFVDDGSTDGTDQRLREIAARDSHVKIVQFRRNFGQTAAMQAGINMAGGDVIVTLDGDLQNDPTDIPMMLNKLDEGYDLVHGWRKNRKDTFINRRLPSIIANWVISKTTGFPIHDLGCTLKVIRSDIAKELELYGELHRFIPILAYQRGARCAEVVTNHHPRRFGKTKYGIGRTLRVVLDLLTVKFMLDYVASPIKLFGMIGFWCAVLAGISCVATVGMKLFGAVDMTGNPLLLLTALATVMSVQFASLGLLGEVNARTYYGSQNKQHYAVRELVNFDAADSPPERIGRRAA
jgi:glycosyltransferase involved in cell wall biosynthesis